jgi:opacity protein-like surface antigen
MPDTRRISGSRRGIRRLAGIVVAVLFASAVLAPGALAHVGTEFAHLWNQHIKPLLATPGTMNAADNPVDWTKLKGVPAGLADGLDNGVDRAGFGLRRNVVLGGGSEFAVDPTKVQRRLTAFCGAGSAIQGVDQSGQVTCSRGPAGYSLATNDTGIICNDWCSEGALTVPAGTYAVTAKIVVRQTIDGDSLEGECRLDIPGQTYVDWTHVWQNEYEFMGIGLGLQGLVTLGAEGSIHVACRDYDIGDSYGGWLRIQAIRLGA